MTPVSNQLENIPVIAIVGPTAIGKTSLSIDAASALGGEIVSVDSMQVYKFMDIGTAKITHEEMCGIPHHLISIVYPDDDFDAARFAKEASCAILDIRRRGRVPLLAGGTGLYLKGLTEGLFADIPQDKVLRGKLKARLNAEGCGKMYKELALADPESAQRIHPNDTARVLRGLEILYSTGVPWSEHIRRQSDSSGAGILKNILHIGLNCERTILYRRINLRTEQMLVQGLENEVKHLLEMGYPEHLKSMNSIGYRHMINFINGYWDATEMKEILARDTRRYAKRQLTWFKRIPDIQWFDVSDTANIIHYMKSWLISRR